MKPNILLLHGAIGSKQQLQPLASLLKNDFSVHLIDFAGHGGDGELEHFSIKAFAQQIVSYIQENKLAPVVVFGYSMGGYVALYLAAHQPDLIKCICTLATKFLWNSEISAKEMKMLNTDKIEEKLPAFALELQQRHAPHDWKIVLQKTTSMLKEMGKENPLSADMYAAIQIPVLLMIGDQDKMVSIEETAQIQKLLPNAEMKILRDTPHPIEQVDAKQLHLALTEFAKF